MTDAIAEAVRAVANAQQPASHKPRLWLCYARDAYTTARHLQAALETLKEFEVIGMGPGHPRPLPQQVNLPQLVKREGYCPDILFTLEGAAPMTYTGLETLPCLKVTYLIDTHLHEAPAETPLYDHVLLCHRQNLPQFDTAKTSWLPVGADLAVHHEIPNLPQPYDVAFVGGVDLSEVHWPRRRMLKALVDAGISVCACRTTGLWMSFIYSKAKLVFNCSVKGDLNMRIFEGAACRRAVLTNRLHPESGLEAIGFKDKESIILYDEDTLVETVKHYLSAKKERQAIAAAGYEIIKDNGTYTHRAQDLGRLFARLLLERQALHA